MFGGWTGAWERSWLVDGPSPSTVLGPAQSKSIGAKQHRTNFGKKILKFINLKGLLNFWSMSMQGSYKI